MDAIRDMTTYFRDLLADKRSHPGDDLISALLATQDPKDRLSDEEIVVQLIFLHDAGHGTTENLIGNGLVHLLANPEQLARLRADPGLDANAVEELLAIRRTHPVRPAHRHGSHRAPRRSPSPPAAT